MTQAEKNILLRDWNVFQKKMEEKWNKQVLDMLKSQMQSFYDAGKKIGWHFALNSLDFLIKSEPVVEVYKKMMADAGTRWGAMTWRRYKSIKRTGDDVASDLLKEILNYFDQYFLDAAAGITDYTKQIIRERVDQGLADGKGYEEIAQSLIDDEINIVRARRITRTETVTASNYGAMQGAKKTGLRLNKEWISVIDKRTRHHHIMANGQLVSMDSDFDVSGNAMAQPGDPKAPLGERVNCRCIVAFVPIRDTSGRVMRMNGAAAA